MPKQSGSPAKVIIIGAGPGGLTAAYQLCKAGIPSVVLEKDTQAGGLSRTVRNNGYHFDIGGHRFFTKVPAVEEIWREILSDEDFLERSRLSRIYYKKTYFDYPLRAFNAVRGLGLWTSVLVFVSYLHACLRPIKNERTFEDWVSNRFGRKLFTIFFKTYTEKVWGIPCSQLSKEWAAQRIRGLSMLTVVKNALLARRIHKRDVVKSLIDSFHYPRRGPGMMWETAAEKVQKRGSSLRVGCSVERIFWSDSRVTAIEFAEGGARARLEGSHFISTMPLRELIEKMEPPAPLEIQQAASKLSYRDFLTVALIVSRADLFPDNWIYVHDPQVKVGRIQNFKNWSPFMVPDAGKTCLGLEYFCFEGDGLWTMADEQLVELAKAEIAALGLADPGDVEGGVVVRMPKAYPVYDHVYSDALAVVRSFIEGLDNLYPVGRNGMHKYNNQDHSMLTAMLAVENICGAKHDIWKVNVDQDYHEEVSAEPLQTRDFRHLSQTQPRVPLPIPEAELTIIQRAFARVHAQGLGIAVGVTGAIYTFLAVAWVVIRDQEQFFPILELLEHYFVGFSVSWSGAIIGAVYGFLFGYVLGWILAQGRNLSLDVYLYLIRLREEAKALEP